MKKTEAWWLIRTLRSQVMTDLAPHIPKDYFSLADERLRVNSTFKSAKHLESELQWGYKASVLGKELFFDNSITMSAREKAASEILMHLGMLAASESLGNLTKEIATTAKDKGMSNGNANAVAKQLTESHTPTF